jgi:ankyrin repeat protein
VFTGDVEGLRAAFAEHPELVEVIDEPWFHFDKPAIVQAAGARNRELVDALLDLGADIDARSAWANGPYSALHALVDGADARSLDLAEHLVERGAAIDLHAAAGMGRADVIERILDAEPHRVSEPGPDGATPLHLAKDAGIAALLLDRGAEINKRCVDHLSTAAMWAAGGREDVVRLLLERGARADLFLAVIVEDVELAARILVDDPSAIDVHVRFGKSHPHVGFGDKYVWTLGGAETPLELARRRGADAIYAFLLERSPPSARLVQASRRGDADEVAWLVADGTLLSDIAEADLCDALAGSASGARTLLAHGADPDVRDDGPDATALHHAAWRGELDLADALLDGGADAYLRDGTYSATPLGWANENRQRGMIALLVERAPPDLVDAAMLGLAERVRAGLLADGEPRSVSDAEAVSALRTAAACGHVDVVEVLLDHGVDPTIPHPESGKSALDLATERGHAEVAKALSRRR